VIGRFPALVGIVCAVIMAEFWAFKTDKHEVKTFKIGKLRLQKQYFENIAFES